ncbi:hypothetical protein JCGZ_20236 [Jatropha curcas]|uniref:Uncharacterized protein n=1 Tax=Jatropha curcas TaxID=180498 RepID=A0A067LK39_JATCU|nr:hypothetical protein JCGZ_20236 [Jatropha curcas]
MSQISEIAASAYTLEMETLGALPDISTFDGEPVPVSRNPLTPGTQPLQLLPSPGTEFLVRYETSQMHGFQSELRDATVEMRGASVFRTLDFEQLRGAAVEWRGASTEVRDAAVLQGREDPDQTGCLEGVADGGPTCCSGIQSRGEGLGFILHHLIPVAMHLPESGRPSGAGMSEGFEPGRVLRLGHTSGDSPAESRRIPRYLAHCHHTYASGEDPEYWRSFLNNRELSDAEVEGIPLDSSEEDEDGSSSDDAPLSPPPQAAAGLSRRQR